MLQSLRNCVQLMPVYDFGSVDETITGSATNRNWGYDPVNYNVPEGSYSVSYTHLTLDMLLTLLILVDMFNFISVLLSSSLKPLAS